MPSVARMVDDDSTLGASEGPKDEVEGARTGGCSPYDLPLIPQFPLLSVLVMCVCTVTFT